MNEIFILPGALTIKRPLTTSVDADRYNTDMTALEGITAEIYENIPVMTWQTLLRFEIW